MRSKKTNRDKDVDTDEHGDADGLDTLETLMTDAPLPVKGLEAHGELLWRPRADFGEYLRERRERVELSLRAAALELGISFTRLQKMEAGGRFKAPNLALLAKIATLYKVPTADLLRKAGFELAVPAAVQQELDFELEFDALAFDPELTPRDMDREWSDAYAPRIKKQWVEFAYNFERLHHREPDCLNRIIQSQQQYISPPPTSDPEAYRQWALEQMLRSGALRGSEDSTEFGAYLRHLRKEKGVTLQVASAALGISYGMLHRLEMGERRIDTIEMLRPIVAYYGVVLEDAMRQLGVDDANMRAMYKLETTNLDFIVLMQDADLRPMGMTPQWMEKLSAAQKRHWVEFTERLNTYLERGRPPLQNLVASYRKMKELEARGELSGMVLKS